MATCDPQELLTEARCFFACLTAGQQEAVKLTLLCQILQTLDPMATCDPQTLLEEAKCFHGCLTAGQQQAVELQLLCNLVDAVTNFGDLLTCGDIDPVDVPLRDCALYYNRLTGVLFQWNSTLGVWQ